MKKKKKREREDSGDNKSIHTYTYQCFILSYLISSHLIFSTMNSLPLKHFLLHNFFFYFFFLLMKKFTDFRLLSNH